MVKIKHTTVHFPIAVSIKYFSFISGNFSLLTSHSSCLFILNWDMRKYFNRKKQPTLPHSCRVNMRAMRCVHPLACVSARVGYFPRWTVEEQVNCFLLLRDLCCGLRMPEMISLSSTQRETDNDRETGSGRGSASTPSVLHWLSL